MQKSTNDKNQHMVNEKFILWEALMKKKLLSLLLASAMVVSMVCACGSDTVSYTHLDVYKRQQWRTGKRDGFLQSGDE